MNFLDNKKILFHILPGNNNIQNTAIQVKKKSRNEK